MSYEKAAELNKKLAEQYERAADLSHRLAGAMAMKDVWPEAFDGGNTCALCAREVVTTMQQAERLRKQGKTPELKRCYLRRGDGVEFDIDSATYWRLKEMVSTRSSGG